MSIAESIMDILNVGRFLLIDSTLRLKYIDLLDYNSTHISQPSSYEICL